MKYKHSEETKKKIGLANKGKTPWKGKKHSEETKIRISIGNKGKKRTEEQKKRQGERMKGNTMGFKKGQKIRKGVVLSEETKEKIRKKIKKNPSRYWLGKKKPPFSEEWKRRMSESSKGEKNPSWKGGKSFEPYSVDWTETLKRSIRERDNYICQLCEIHQEELERKLAVHYIDYDKKNLNPKNLITLCNSCHSKTNYNREYWIKYFTKE